MKMLCEDCGKFFDKEEMASSIGDFHLCKSCSGDKSDGKTFILDDDDDLIDNKVIEKDIKDSDIKKAVITSRLVMLISKLNLTEQMQLLKQVEKKVLESKRKYKRKNCSIEIDYSAKERLYKDTIQNISANGLFIETKESIEVGENITLILSLPKQERPFKLNGMVVRSNSSGIGVKFNNLLPELEEKLRVVINNL